MQKFTRGTKWLDGDREGAFFYDKIDKWKETSPESDRYYAIPNEIRLQILFVIIFFLGVLVAVLLGYVLCPSA